MAPYCTAPKSVKARIHSISKSLFELYHMATLLRAIHECLFGVNHHLVNNSCEENIIARDILITLFNAHQGDKHLEKSMQDIIGERGWTENIAKGILGGIENGLKQGVKMGATMAEAFEKAISEASRFAHEHPYFCALIAVGILAILMPWVLEALGFAELGPVEGGINTIKLRTGADQSCRNFCCLVAVNLPRLRNEGILILVLSAARDGLAPIDCKGLSIASLYLVAALASNS